MIKSSIEKLAEDIGFDIGISDDITQSNLLNGFCRGLANSCTDNQLQMQVTCITDKLKPEAIKVIKELAEFIKIKESYGQ